MVLYLKLLVARFIFLVTVPVNVIFTSTNVVLKYAFVHILIVTVIVISLIV